MNDTTQPPQEQAQPDTIDSLLAEYERLRDQYNAYAAQNDMKTANSINAEMMEVAFEVCTLLLKARKEQKAQPDLLAEALEVIEDLVCQACHHTEDGSLDSLGSSSYADGMRFLAKQGRMTITTDQGRRVIGRWNKKP